MGEPVRPTIAFVRSEAWDMGRLIDVETEIHEELRPTIEQLRSNAWDPARLLPEGPRFPRLLANGKRGPSTCKHTAAHGRE